MTISHRLALAAFAAPLVLALSACGAAEDGTEEAEAMEAIAAPDGQEWTDMVQVTDYDGYLLGNPDAPIKLVEYGSLTCGACANFSMTGEAPLVEDYVSTGVVSYELRNQVHNVFDLTLAAMVRCGAPESFHPLSSQVWHSLADLQGGMQQAGAQLGNVDQLPDEQYFPAIAAASGFLDFFAERGISRDQAAACLADKAGILEIGERSNQQSEELNVNSTPTFILNGRQLEERSWPDLEPVLQRAGARPAAG